MSSFFSLCPKNYCIMILGAMKSWGVFFQVKKWTPLSNAYPLKMTKWSNGLGCYFFLSSHFLYQRLIFCISRLIKSNICANGSILSKIFSLISWNWELSTNSSKDNISGKSNICIEAKYGGLGLTFFFIIRSKQLKFITKKTYYILLRTNYCFV